jgi:dCMP deaminase
MENLSWDLRFLDLAKLVSTWSQDPSTKVGAVITDSDNRIVSIGYNGFPKGIKDDERLDNRDLKYKMVLHAEENAILFAKQSLIGCTIYTYPMLPCSNCCAKIIQVGIKNIVSVPNKIPRWSENIALSTKMCEESGVKYSIIGDLNV